MRIVIIAFVLAFTSARAQHQFSCRVLDRNTMDPLTNASVFLPETHRGAYTHSDGYTRIKNIRTSTALVEVSHIGYQSFFKRLIFPADSVLEISLEPTLVPMEEVVITGNQLSAPDETSFNIDQLGTEEISSRPTLNLSDAISRLPGVSQLTTGPGISKPVIRGLFGNRIQVTLNGIRFDNQQWQDEHGLGLSDMGIDRVEIIRGPASVLYGSDAIGGVVNVIEENPAPIDQTQRDLKLRLFSNTYGLSLSYGKMKSAQDRWKKFRIGFDNHSDYSDGSNNRVLNSRFASYNVKMGWGRNRKNRLSVTNLMASHSLFGFVFDSLNRKEPDGRLSRTFDGPHHAVSFVQLTSENTFYRERSQIKFNAGIVSNLRLENEGGAGISLSMLLNTINALGQLTRRPTSESEWTIGASSFFQTNTNFGGRIIIPDAMNGEASFFSYYKNRMGKLVIETGLRYDAKFIETYATRNLNVIGNDSPTEEIVPFARLYHALNITLGAVYFLTDQFSLKTNMSSGFRPGNLAELSSNGLHEGTLRWEIGKPHASLERNFNVEGSLNYSSSFLRSTLSIYSNNFKDFFYLSTDGSEFFGFQVYHFKQSDARINGAELSVEVSPKGSRFGFSGGYTLIDALKDDHERLPFIPANKITGDIRLKLDDQNEFVNWWIVAGGSYAFTQSHPAQFETRTPGYFLLNCSLNAQWRNTIISLSGSNLLNKSYFDHLSRYKYYGIQNMGRMIVLNLNFKL